MDRINRASRLRTASPQIWLALAAFVFTMIACVYYVLVPARGEFHSDCADTLFWAQAAWDSGKLLDPDFYYACALPLGGQLFMLPFYGLFGFSMKTQALGILLFLATFCGAMFFFFRSLRLSWARTLVCVSAVLCVCLGSFKLREMFFGHILYYSYSLLFTFVLLGVWERLRKAENRVWGWLALMAAACAVCASNGFSILAMTVVPMAGMMLFHLYQLLLSGADNKKIRRWLWAAGAAAAGVAVGLALHAWLTAGIEAPYEQGYGDFSSSKGWAGNLQTLLSGWFSLIGGEPSGSMITVEGAAFLLRAAWALLILALPMGLLFREASRPLCPLSDANHWHWTQAAVLLAGWIFGRLNEGNWRLTALAITGTVVTLLWLCRQWDGWPKVSRRAAAACLCLTLGGSALGVYSLPTNFKITNVNYALRDFFAENQLDYGYADFWNCGVITAISDESIKVRNIEYDSEHGGYKPYLYQTRSEWYEDQPDQSQYFILLTSKQAEAIEAQGWAVLDKAVEVLNFYYTYVVYVFDFNPMRP